jgi:hypothetical protein
MYSKGQGSALAFQRVTFWDRFRRAAGWRPDRDPEASATSGRYYGLFHYFSRTPVSPSDSLDSMADEPQKTQKTRPKGTDADGQPAEPIEIPVPKREDVEDALDRLIEAKSDD